MGDMIYIPLGGPGTCLIRHQPASILFFLPSQACTSVPGKPRVLTTLVHVTLHHPPYRWVDVGREARVCRCQPYSVHINMDTFEEMLALKQAKDEVCMHMCWVLRGGGMMS